MGGVKWKSRKGEKEETWAESEKENSFLPKTRPEQYKSVTRVPNEARAASIGRQVGVIRPVGVAD